MQNIDLLLHECGLSSEQIKYDERLSKHTTFRIGGPADCFVIPHNSEQFSKIIKMCNKLKIPFFVLGNGSNVLVKESGIRGVVISTKGLNTIELSKPFCVKVGAGVMLKEVAYFALDNSLTGFEFASGIPGTVGGAVFMNAGAYEGDINGVFVSCETIDMLGNIKVHTKEEMSFSYRYSLAQDKNLIVTNATFRLESGNYDEILSRIRDLTHRRNERQPIELPSAGSTFKRPEGYFAGKLIMDSGLSGFAVGGAKVSEKHCGFIVNYNNATFCDVYELINHVQKVVYDKYSVRLEPEVRIIGDVE